MLLWMKHTGSITQGTVSALVERFKAATGLADHDICLVPPHGAMRGVRVFRGVEVIHSGSVPEDTVLVTVKASGC